MIFTLIINTDDAKPVRTSEHGNLRDARAALIHYEASRGLRLTIGRWFTNCGLAMQDGDLMAGMDVVGDWAISYPLADERLPA